VIRLAGTADRGDVCDLLAAAKLPLDGLSETLEHFLVAEEDGRIVAVAGIEVYGDSVLLRSVVVAAEHRGTGMGGRLSDASLALARELGARHAYLLTDTAEAFFFIDGATVLALALLGVASLIAAHAAIVVPSRGFAR